MSEVAKANSKEFKRLLRKRIWDLMVKKGIATFPLPPHGRIPNFIGAEEAAKRLQGMSIFKQADVIKVNPDSPQKSVRKLALINGKTVVMPTPRLHGGFVVLDPDKIPARRFSFAATLKGGLQLGKECKLKDLPIIDLVVTGCVAVSLNGVRIGKGGGYSELEYAILRELGLVSEKTPVITTVHEVQVIDWAPKEPFDLIVDVIVTPRRILRVKGGGSRPPGVFWDLISEELLEKMPVLRDLKSYRNR